jgi:tetratricopeptide (TPR) repeat protein
MQRWHIFSWFIIIAAVFIAYANIYQNEFVYDDEFLIQKNQNIRTWDGVPQSFAMSSTGGSGAVDSFYRPMQGVFYTIVYQLHGLYPDGFHVLNLLLHLICALLIFSLACRLEFSPLAALIGALIWAVHPIHTEAVTYASATADPSYALFILAGLFFAAPDFSPAKIMASIPFYVLAICCKETGIVFPAMMIACIFLMSDRRWVPRTYFKTWPLWLMAILYLVMRKTILNFDNTFEFYKTANIYTENIGYRILTFLATIPSYLALLVWPENLQMDHQFSVFITPWAPPVLVGVAWLLLGLLMLAWERNSERPIWSWAFLWFFAAHVPHTGVLLPVNSIFLEHWMYLPSIAFFVALAQTLTEKVREPWWALVPTVGVAGALGYATFQQNEVWATPVSLYTHILQLNPRVARVHNNLAMAYSDLHQDQQAIEHYRKAIELSDVYPQTHHNFGLALLRLGHPEEGVAQLKRALELDANFYHSARVLAELYHQAGDTANEQHYTQVYNTAMAKFSH